MAQQLGALAAFREARGLWRSAPRRISDGLDLFSLSPSLEIKWVDSRPTKAMGGSIPDPISIQKDPGSIPSIYRAARDFLRASSTTCTSPCTHTQCPSLFIHSINIYCTPKYIPKHVKVNKIDAANIAGEMGKLAYFTRHHRGR